MSRYLGKILLAIFCLATLDGQAQDADKKIEDLITKGDYFELNRQYPQVKDSLSHFVSSYARTIIYFYFYNSPQTVVMECDELLNSYRGQLGASDIMTIASLKAQSLANGNKYLEAAQILQNLLTQYSAQMYQSIQTDCKLALQRYKAMAKLPIQKMERPGKDCEAQILFDKVGDGEQLQIKAKIQGQETNFVYDTGASVNLITQSFAKKYNLKMLNSTIELSGIGGHDLARLAVADSIQLGEITIRNVSFAVIPDSNLNIHFIGEKANTPVLGMPVIHAIGEMQLFPQKGKIVFPFRESPLLPSGSNLMIKSSQPYIEILNNADRLVVHFDTGSSVDKLSVKYYLKNETEIKKIGTKEKLRIGGLGGIRLTDSYILPEATFRVIDKDITIFNIPVDTESDIFTQNLDGVLGVEFLKQCKLVLINFNKMYVYVE